MMLTHTTRWSLPPGNTVVPSSWQATDTGEPMAVLYAQVMHWAHRRVTHKYFLDHG
jgi:hypothetical protein